MPDAMVNLGETQSTHRTFSLSLIFWPLLLVPLLITAGAAAFYSFGPSTSAGGRTGPIICLGGSGLFIAVIGSVWLSELRKWHATRTVKLSIYQEGFAYESKGQTEVCRWSEIKDITHSRIEVRSKHSAPQKVNVIRSVVRSDGQLITLADTLDLRKITGIIATAHNEYKKR